MAFLQYSNGVRLEWDETLSPGALIRTYYKGYFVLEGIEFVDEPDANTRFARESYNISLESYSHEDMKECPIFHFVQVLKEDGTKSKVLRKSCSAAYCTRVTKDEVVQQFKAESHQAAMKSLAIQSFL